MLDGKTVTREDLIEAFSDGKTLDGKDFESLISSMVMQSASDTAFDDKTMGMLTANDYQMVRTCLNANRCSCTERKPTPQVWLLIRCAIIHKTTAITQLERVWKSLIA